MRAIAQLTDQGAARIESALGSVPRHLTSDRLASIIGEAAPEVADDATDVIEAVLSLVGLLPEDSPSPVELAREVGESPDIDLEDAQRTTFVDRLTRLLGVEALVLSSRALDVITEHENTFHNARILTDLRPVFGTEIANGPAVAAVVAMLKVDYHAGDRAVTSSYFAMDHSDLLLLRSVIDRAITKVESLRKLIDRMDIPYWEYEEPSDASDS